MNDAARAIAEPNRRQILELVREEELPAGSIAERFDLTRPAISQHLTVLKDAGLVEERRDGARRLYRARPAGLAELRLFLEAFWDERLGALRDEAEEADTGARIGERVSVEREIEIVARPETVWQLFVDPKRLTRWMGRRAVLDVREGGQYRVEVLPGQFAVGEYRVVDPPRRLVHTWGWEVEGGNAVLPGSTTVSIRLHERRDGTTRLVLTHRGLPTIASAGSHSIGWEHYLDRLLAIVSGANPGPDPWVTDAARMRVELRP